jgi:hypothetical protein
LAAKSGEVLTVRTPAFWRCRTRGDDQSLALAVEKLDAERGLQRFDLMTDRSLGDAQFLGGSREAFAPRRRLECPERVEWRQLARHRLLS